MVMREKDDELFEDIEELITTSLQDATGENDEDIFDSLCKSIAKTDSCDESRVEADKGDAGAALQVAGWHIANAQNILDYCKANKYAKKAAKGGYIEAYYILGQLALYGTGCTRNIPRAIKYLRYFVENIEEKDLPNEAVLVDAYAKLGEAEAIRGNRRRAYQYYLAAQERERRFSTQLAVLRTEMADTQRGYFFAAVVLATTFLCVCGMMLFYVNYFSGDGIYAKYLPWNVEEQVQVIDRD